VTARRRPGVPTTGPLTPDDEELLLRAAAAAPSVHNTQPWLLATSAARVDVFADPSRRLRHGDPHGRSMLVSVGAAVLDVRVDHGAQRLVLQVRELRDDERLRLVP